MSESEFKNYVQRLDRCRAIRFMRSDQVDGIAELFGTRTYSVAGRDYPTMVLTLVVQRSESEEEEIVIRRGDYVVEKDVYFGGLFIARREDFDPQYEEAPK